MRWTDFRKPLPAAETADRIVLIGQAPNRIGRDDVLVRACARLALFADLRLDDLLGRTDRVNLFLVFPGKNGKGDSFNDKLARSRARRMTPGLFDRRVILLGRRVARAFDFRESVFTFHLHHGADIAMMPHPSGINPFYNDSANRRRAGKFLRSALSSTRAP